MNLFQLPLVFEDLDEVHNALVNKSVDGILEELFTATEYFELLYENPSLSIVHFYEEKHGYGIAFKSLYVKLDFGQVWDCMSFVASFIANDKYDFLKRHVHRAKVRKSANSKSCHEVSEAVQLHSLTRSLHSSLFQASRYSAKRKQLRVKSESTQAPIHFSHSFFSLSRLSAGSLEQANSNPNIFPVRPMLNSTFAPESLWAYLWKVSGGSREKVFLWRFSCNGVDF